MTILKYMNFKETKNFLPEKQIQSQIYDLESIILFYLIKKFAQNLLQIINESYLKSKVCFKRS